MKRRNGATVSVGTQKRLEKEKRRRGEEGRTGGLLIPFSPLPLFTDSTF
jgi:hypothetical protein